MQSSVTTKSSSAAFWNSLTRDAD